MRTQAKRVYTRKSARPSSGTRAKHRAKPTAATKTAAAHNRKPPARKQKPASGPAPRRKAAPPPDRQQLAYDEAVRLFQAQKFERADALFQKAMQGDNRALAHHAQVHSRICRQRLRPPEMKLRTAEDHYNYAVTLINARRLDEAARHLEAALHSAPKADYLHYAMAATQALLGNRQAAYERLKTAVELQPRNRILARGDADFAGILEYPPVASLLQIQRWNSSKTV